MQTGYGWDPTGTSSSGSGSASEHSYEERMRAEIRFRARAGASGWHGRNRPRYADGDGGRGAWGGFRGGDGKWEAYDTGEFTGPQGTGEERYMTNGQFLGLIAGIVSFHRLASRAGAAVEKSEYSPGLGAVPPVYTRQRPGI